MAELASGRKLAKGIGGGLSLRVSDSLLLLLVLVSLVGLGLLGRSFLSTQSDNRALEEQIVQQANQASILSKRAVSLRTEAAVVDNHLVSLRAHLPATLPAVELLAFVHRSSVESGVKISSVQWEPPKVAGQKDSPLLVGKFKITAAAELPRLANFIDRLERGQYKSMVVDDFKGGVGDSTLTVSVYTQP